VPENDSGTVRYALHFLVGVTMKLALLGRQALMGVMAVALVAG
jgi:cystine transport system substrate-binding protein